MINRPVMTTVPGFTKFSTSPEFLWFITKIPGGSFSTPMSPVIIIFPRLPALRYSQYVSPVFLRLIHCSGHCEGLLLNSPDKNDSSRRDAQKYRLPDLIFQSA